MSQTHRLARLGAVTVLGFLGAIAGCDGDKSSTSSSTPNQAKGPSASPSAATPAVMVVKAPLGLPEVPVPKDNPMTAAKVELGRMLYFDKRMSKDGTIACATCHDPSMGWAEHRASSEGISKQVGERNSPTVINAAYMPVQFWDGRAATLEEQALGPIENPIEMGHSMLEVTKALAAVPEYKKRFNEVFGTDVTTDGIAKAIAAFERTVVSGNSPCDKFKAGDAKALDDAQKRGMALFMDKGNCVTCHSEPFFSNGKYYNAGVGSDAAKPDAGRKSVTKQDADMGKFRVPHLRNVAQTHPYFHNGSAKTLEEAVRLMATGGKDNPNLSPILKGVREAKLTDQEIADLAAFLKALSGEVAMVEAPKLP